MKYYSAKEFSMVTGVSYRTLLNWDKEGKLVADRSLSGKRVYTEEHIKQYLGKKNKEGNKIIEG